VARVGTVKVGEAKVGRTLDAAAQAAWNVLAGTGPSTPGRAVPLRARCAELRTFDPTTWTPGAPLVGVSAVGANRTAQLTDGIQTEQLTFTCLNAGQIDALPPGAWVAVAWTVAVAGATTHHQSVYRIAGAAQRERTRGGTTYTLQAVDWFQYDASRFDFPGYLGAKWLEDLRTAYLASGLPWFWDSMSYIPVNEQAVGNTLAGAVLQRATAWTSGLVPLRVSPWGTMAWAWTAVDVLGGPASLVVGPLGEPSTLYDGLRKLGLLSGGFLLGYGPDGYLELRPGGDRGTASGAYLTRDATPLGSVPLPWAAPLVRDASARPEFDAVIYNLHRDPPPDATDWQLAELGSGIAFLGSARSESAVHPPGTAMRGTETVVDQLPWWGADVNHTFQGMGYPSYVAWCRAHLRLSLAAADTLTLAVDPAYPPPACGTLVRVHHPPEVDGDYQLVGFTQPLTAQFAEWQLRWWADASAAAGGDA
jgi:hypothetical protein